MDTNSLSKTGRAIPTVSKDTKGEGGKKQTVHTGGYFDNSGEQFNDGRRQRGGGGGQPCCTRRQEVCLEMDGTRLLIRSDLICGQTFYIWRYVGPASVLSEAICPHKGKINK